jgi:hypothetical protein
VGRLENLCLLTACKRATVHNGSHNFSCAREAFPDKVLEGRKVRVGCGELVGSRFIGGYELQSL